MTLPLSVEQAKLNLRNSAALLRLCEGNHDEVLMCIDLLIAAVRADALREQTVTYLNTLTAALDTERRRWYAALEQEFGLPPNALEGFAPEVAATRLTEPT